MATLSYTDLEKRQNVDVFVDRVNNGGFQVNDDASPSLQSTGVVVVKLGANTLKFNKQNPLNSATVSMFLNTKASSDYIEIQLQDGKMYRPGKLYKDKAFGGVAGKSTGAGSERQELGLIKAINEAASSSSSIAIKQISTTEKIRSASKNEKLSAVGQEPYIDVFIETNKKKHGISCKGTTAPSLAGGGTAGLKVIVPDLLDKLYRSIQRELKAMHIKHGDVLAADSIPEFYFEIPSSYVDDILRGNARMGGPIDFMYVGPMDVSSSITGTSLNLNGNFYSIDEYMRKIGRFYFRVRRRDLDKDGMIQIEFNRRSKEGYPLMFASPSKGKNNLRIVITDKIPSTGKLVKLR